MEPPRPNPLTDLDPPPPTKLSENIILSVLVEIGNTLRSSAHESKILIQNMLIAKHIRTGLYWGMSLVLWSKRTSPSSKTAKPLKNAIKTENRKQNRQNR